jgi:hypothetical protein
MGSSAISQNVPQVTEASAGNLIFDYHVTMLIVFVGAGLDDDRAFGAGLFTDVPGAAKAATSHHIVASQ